MVNREILDLRFENIEKRIKIKEARTKNQDFFEKTNTLRPLGLQLRRKEWMLETK
jgi:hypothetical protein